jgi:hypothetical protein
VGTVPLLGDAQVQALTDVDITEFLTYLEL